MRLKILSGSKQQVMTLEDTATLQDLINELVASKLIDDNIIPTIRAGFPPKSVSMSDLSMSLTAAGILNGDKLVLDTTAKPPSPTKHTAREFTPDAPPFSKRPKRSAPTATSKPKQQQEPDELPNVKLPDGLWTCVLRSTPDDNSCLFKSIAYAVYHNMDEGPTLRTVVANHIQSQPDLYSEAILGKPVEEYTAWIQKPTSWGGAIELEILSGYLDVTIYSVDVETGHVYTFNPERKKFIYLLYTGVHYDTVALTMNPVLDARESDISLYPVGSEVGEYVTKTVKELRAKLNHKGYVTNTNTFSIKCNICGEVMKGEKGALKHAQETTHTDFGEV